MSFSDFNDLCSSVCDLLGEPVPTLAPDENGVLAFTVTVGEVGHGVVLDQSATELGAVMITVLGPAEPDQELQVLRRLMDTNFLLSGVYGPSLVRNPSTGEIALHQPIVMNRHTAQDVFAMLLRAVDVVSLWKDGLSLNELQPSH